MTARKHVLFEIISGTNYFCSLCLETNKEDDKLFNIKDKVFLDDQNSTELFEILSCVLGDQYLDNMSTLGAVCQQCTSTAIACYKFIIKCQNNSQQLGSVVDSLCNNFIHLKQEIDSNKSLFVTLNMKDLTINEYYDQTRTMNNPATILKKFKHIEKKNYVKHKLTRESFEDSDYHTDFKIDYRDKKIKSINKEANNSLNILQLHEILQETDDKSVFKCKICLKHYARLQYLKQHYFRAHAPKEYKCSECSRTFGSEVLLNIHKSQCHCVCVCSKCGKVYRSRHSLRRHERGHKMTLSCPTCKKVYKGRHNFNNHIVNKLCKKTRKLNSDATLICNYCNKKYSHKITLSIHIQIEHENGKAHVCDWCGKRFFAHSKLKEHIITHTKEKNFSCELCGGQFVTKMSLLYHTRTHTGEKPYKCSHCDITFLSASRRSEHVRRHHMAPSLECDKCDRKFSNRSCLTKHRKRHLDPDSRLHCDEGT